MTGSVWTVDRVARLEALWSDPAMTPKKIAGRLGVSHGAVLGKAMRLGLVNRRRKPTPLKRPIIMEIITIVDQLADRTHHYDLRDRARALLKRLDP